MKKKVCPMCGAHNFEQKHSAEEIQTNKASFPQIAPLPKGEQLTVDLERLNEKLDANYARVKAKRIEDNRIWRIKRAEKKAAKKAAKMAS
jgi:hypothetical protein